MKIQFLTRINLLLYGVWLTAMVLITPVQAGVIEPALQQAMQGGEEVSFIIHFEEQLDLSAFPGRGKGKGLELASLLWALRNQADSSQAEAIELLKVRGVKRLIQLWSINGLAATAYPAVIEEVASLQGVGDIVLDTALAAPSPDPAVATTPEWNLDMIRAPEFWNNYSVDGHGTVVASMDTGVDLLHLDLADSYRGGGNSWFDPNGQHETPHDRAGVVYSGHGTQVTSLMVGGDASGTSIGVAPGAQWISVKIFNDAGLASLSAIHQGFQWLLDPDGKPGTNDQPDVVNNSWGFPTKVGECYTEFEPDIQVLKIAGIAVVFSAGNQGTLGGVSPANNPSSFAVGSVDESENVAGTSSRGPSACGGTIFPDIVAPGVSVKAADLTTGGLYPLSYVNVFGTSFAAPHVSATMALLRKAYPEATVEQLEQALMDSAFDPYVNGPDDTYGYGIVDAVEAYNKLAGQTFPVCTDEIKHDGIDQDCNGYDLTIDIAKATYNVADKTLTVEATSDLGADADLLLLGYGPMNWSKKGGGKYSLSVDSVQANPETVVVSGVEGYDLATTTVEEGGSSGGDKGGGKPKKK